MSTSFTPVLPKLCTHLQGFVTKIASLWVHKSTHYKHHPFLEKTKQNKTKQIQKAKSVTGNYNKCNDTNYPVRLRCLC